MASVESVMGPIGMETDLTREHAEEHDFLTRMNSQYGVLQLTLAEILTTSFQLIEKLVRFEQRKTRGGVI